MIVFGIAEGGDRIFEIASCDVLVAESELIAFGGELAARVLGAQPEMASPVSLWRVARRSGGRCCACELATGREVSIAGTIRGHGDNLMLSRAVLVFAESERAALGAFLESQAERTVVGPPYGGDHYSDCCREAKESAGDLVVWVDEGGAS